MEILILVSICVLIFPGVFIYLKRKESKKAVLVKCELTFAILLLSLYLGMDSTLGIYPYLISGGLLLGLLGDWAITKSLNGGLVFFLIGHLVYTVAFVYLGGFSIYCIAVFIVLYLLIILVYKKLKPDLQGMLIPIAIYTAIIFAMLSIAVVLPFTAENNTQLSMRIIVAVGAALFTLSDMLLASNMFIKKTDSDSVVSIYTYFISQLLIAASLF